MRFRNWINLRIESTGQMGAGVVSFRSIAFHGSPKRGITEQDLEPCNGDLGYGYYFTKNRRYANRFVASGGGNRGTIDDEGKLYSFLVTFKRAIASDVWGMTPEDYQVYQNHCGEWTRTIDLRNPDDNNWFTLKYYLGEEASVVAQKMGYEGVISDYLDEIIAFSPKSFRLQNRFERPHAANGIYAGPNMRTASTAV